MICPECEQEFEPATANQRYHDKACARRAEKRRARERKQTDKQLVKSAIQRQAGTQYSDEEREFLLRALAITAGNANRAASELAHHDIQTSPGALLNLRRKHPEDYARIRDQVQPKLKEGRAEVHESMADRILDLVDKMVDGLEERMKSGDFTYSPSAIREATLAAAIHRDKASKLRGEDITVIQHQSVKEIEAGLRRLGVIDGEATEIPDELPPAA